MYIVLEIELRSYFNF